MKLQDNYGDVLRFIKRDQDRWPGETVASVNDRAGVILRAEDVRKLRDYCNRLLDND